MAPRDDSTRYWLAEPDSEDFMVLARARLGRYHDWLKTSGRAGRMARSWSCLYGFSPSGEGDTSAVRASGDAGEFVDVATNDYAKLVEQTVVMITQNKPAFKAIASNRDFESLAQATFAQSLLEHYERQQSLAERDHEVVLGGVALSESWEVQAWVASAGRTLAVDSQGSEVKEGDIAVYACTPYDVAYDPDARNVDALQWFAFRIPVNRFDLIASHPDMEDELRKLPSVIRGPMAGEDDSDFQRSSGFLSRATSPDLVWQWEIRALPSPALPNGRLVQAITEKCVLFDSLTAPDADGNPSDAGYPYSEMHAYQIKPGVILGSIGGHTAHFDNLSLQECLDTAVTQAATAANAGGISNYWQRPGAAPNVTQVSDSMNFVVSPEKPELLEGPQLSPQVPGFLALVQRFMVQRIGLNDVALGEPTKGMPAQLAALLQSQAVQFHSRLAASYARMLERSRTGMLRMLKRYAVKTDKPRQALIAGKAESYAFREWCNDDLSGVDRVVVESVNPAMMTQAGRETTASELLEHNLVKDAQEYLLLKSTGRIEPMLDGAQSNLMRIQEEKQMLQKGIGLAPVDQVATVQAMAKDPTALPVLKDDGQPHIRPSIYDTHWLDIPEYKAVGNMPDARDNPRVQEAVNDCISFKLKLWRKMDPLMQMLLGCPPNLIQGLPPPMSGTQPGPQGGPPSQSGPGKPGETDATQPPVADLPDGASRIPQARPPKDPSTGRPVAVGPPQ